MPHLVFLDEPFGGRSYELICERTTVGRGIENTLTIRDASLSHEHCEILSFGAEVIVRDLGSRNGTFIDGHRLDGTQAQAKHGQTISFGNVQVKLEIDYVEEESDEDTAFYDFIKYREPEQPVLAAEAVHLALPDRDDFINETIQLRATTAAALTGPANASEPSPVATTHLPIPWLIVAISLLLLFLVSLLR